MTMFKRFNAIMAAASAMFNIGQQAEAQAMLKTYESRGKGGKVAHRHTGIAAARRAKVTAKGRAQNRRNHRAH